MYSLTIKWYALTIVPYEHRKILNCSGLKRKQCWGPSCPLSWFEQFRILTRWIIIGQTMLYTVLFTWLGTNSLRPFLIGTKPKTRTFTLKSRPIISLYIGLKTYPIEIVCQVQKLLNQNTVHFGLVFHHEPKI